MDLQNNDDYAEEVKELKKDLREQTEMKKAKTSMWMNKKKARKTSSLEKAKTII